MKLASWILNKIRTWLKIYTLDSPLEWVIQKYIHPDFFFIQIGGNDGNITDPITRIVRKKRMAGLIVEPVKEYFNELKQNYSEYPKVSLANYAIYKENKPLTIYRVDSRRADLPIWAKGIASIDRDHYQKTDIPKDAMIEEIVQGITFIDLLKQYNISFADLLVIDTEGYDYEILKMIDFDSFRPTIISFEHGFPNNIMSKDHFFEITRLLINQGYKIITLDYDCIAYL